MTEEIKEILEDLGNKDNYIEEYGCQYKRINLYDSFQLLDYITNLQEENERLKEKLKNRPIVDFTFDVYKELEDYKSRCEKAIEYINENLTLVSILDGKKFYGLNDYKFSYLDLLNILQGSDNND